LKYIELSTGREIWITSFSLPIPTSLRRIFT